MGTPTRTLSALLFALLICVSPGVTAQELEEKDGWDELVDAVDLTFTAPPIKAHFGNLDRELKISRRDPFTGAARNKIAARRQKADLKREQVFVEREKREGVVLRIGGR